MTHRIFLPLLALPVGALSSNAAVSSFYVDFGPGNNTTVGNYNNVTVTGVSESSQSFTLVDSEGSSADNYGFSATSADQLSGTNDATNLTPYTTPFELTANQDSIYFDNGETMTVTLSNLDVGLTYDLTMFSSRASTSSRITQFELTAGTLSGNTVVQLQTMNNQGNTVGFSGVTPDVSGNITFEVQQNTSFGYINALEITAVPEPSTYVILMGVCGLGFALWRRRQ
ncbi:PEP-CTERM sorting domain-containing protein [Cerasicoccus maritimus]|uniref:PEP-CTERM sorting domain-containing protein n=1 Tax=Cerasicoccus maritimus TaxID=490089 RepID=UPI002852B57A|nr:PEP-CTERM sorting domain-containing protein [Cerasicoccus maritimus]